VANYGGANLSAFTVAATGALTPVSGSPYRLGQAPMSVAVDPSGKFVYAANAGSNNIMAFTINSSTGGLTPIKGSPYSHDATPFAVAIAGQ